MKTICVDAGHGGADFGAKNRHGLLEKDCTLALSILTAAELMDQGFHILLTRRGDYDLPLEERSATAHMGGACGYLSLHCAQDAPGTRFFVFKQNADAQRWAHRLGGGFKKQLCPPLGYRGVMAGNYEKLQGFQIPAVFIEVACIQHPKESALLLDEHFLHKIANVIAKNTASFFQGT